MLELEYLFERVQNVSKKLRKKNPKLDGRLFWQPIKDILNEVNIPFTSWKHITKTHQALLLLDEKDSKDAIIEKLHFLRQHANIPYNDPPTFTKIIQIALNIGQWLGVTTSKERIQMKYQTSYKELQTYVRKKDIITLSKKIPKETIQKIDTYLSKY